MAEPTLLLDAGFISAMGSAYAAVAWRLRKRIAPSGPGRQALALFGLWWSGIAGLFLLSGLAGALRAFAVDPPGLHLAITLAGMACVCAGVWGILYYITYLFSGRRTMLAPYLAYYAAVFVVLAYGAIADPSQAEAWRVSVSRLVILTGPVVTFGIVAFLVPVVVASGFYFSLYFRVEDPVQKYRVGLTSVAFAIWFGSAILAATLGFAHAPWWTTAGRAIGVFASGLVLLGYWPPRSVRARSLEMDALQA